MTDWSIGGVGFIIVEVEGRYEEKIGKGIEGKELVADIRYEPLKYVKTCGRVVQIPFAQGERPLYQVPIGFPGYGAQRGNKPEDAHAALYAIGGHYKWKKLSDIHPEVNIGDTIWFNRTVLHNPSNLLDEGERDGNKIFTFKVDYDLVICVEEEEPKMIGGWCFLDPMYENWQKMMRPTFTDLKDAEDNPIPKPKDQWLVFALTPPMQKFVAMLKHFGTPLKGDEFDFEKEAEVFIRPRSKHIMYKYKGVEYILLHYWEILAEVK